MTSSCAANGVRWCEEELEEKNAEQASEIEALKAKLAKIDEQHQEETASMQEDNKRSREDVQRLKLELTQKGDELERKEEELQKLKRDM